MSIQLRNPWWIVLGSVLGLIVGNVTVLQFSTSVLMKPIMAEFGWNRSVLSAAVMLGSFCAAAATPFVGRLIDKHGVKPITLLAISFFALSTAAMSLAPAAAPVFIGMFCVLGVFSGGQAPLPYAKSIAGAFDRRRGLAMGIAMTGVGLGTALIPKLAQLYLDNFGWRGAYVALGATVFVIAFPAVALFLSEPTARRGALTSAMLPGLEARQVVRTTNFWVLSFVFLCIPIVANGIIVHLAPLLTDRGIPAQQAVSIFASIGASLIVGRLACGYFLDRFFAPHVAIAFIVIPALGVITLLASSDPVLTTVGAVMVGIGLGAEVDLIGYLQSRYFGLRAFGQVYGYLFAIFTVGTGLGPFVMAATFDATGSYSTALIGFVATLACAAVALLRMPRTYAFPVQHAGTEAIAPVSQAASGIRPA
ncbi:MFS transporter [Variovorax sp. dw_954]|uniref:MFS transporter n=1 Tax=Variovorax sp. dw_954 TaxID=2720078 RepID=UPI0031F68C7F